MANLKDLASNLFNQGGQKVNPILQYLGNTFRPQTGTIATAGRNAIQKIGSIPLSAQNQYRADIGLGLLQGVKQGIGGFTGIENKFPSFMNYNYQPVSKVGKTANFAGGALGYAFGAGKLLGPVERTVQAAVFVPKLAKAAPLASKALNFVARKTLPALAAEAATAVPTSLIQSKITGNPLLQTYGNNLAGNVAGRAVGEGINIAAPIVGKAGKQVVISTKKAVKQTEAELFNKFLNGTLQEEQNIISSLGTQTRDAVGKFGQKNPIVRAIGSGDILDKNIPLLRLVFEDGREMRVPASKLLQDKTLAQYVQGPANSAAERIYKQAFSGGFIKPDELNPFKDPQIDRTKLAGIQLEKTNAELLPLKNALPDAIQVVEKDILPKANIPPSSKVNIIDYFRTPQKVLKKIGLENQGALLKQKYDDYLNELPKEISRVTEWSKRASDPDSSQRIFQYLDGQPAVLKPEEQQVAREIQSYLSSWADRLGLPKDKRVTNYITHLFDEDLIKKEFDPDFAKLITDRAPGSVYDPFLEKRMGGVGYKEDVWQALDAYIKRGVRKVNMDVALKPLKEASEKLDLESQKYIVKLGERVNLRPTEIDNLMDNFIKSTPVGYQFGARPTSVISKGIRQAVYRGTLGLNIGSAVRNLTQASNTYAELGEKNTIKGYVSLIKNFNGKELEDVGVLRDDIVQDRVLNSVKKRWERIDKVLFFLFETAEKINRGAAYYGAKSKYLSEGLSEPEAVKRALQLVEKTQFRFGSVDTPVTPLLSSDLGKLASQFQSFGVKQAEFLSDKAIKKEYAGIARYIASNIFLVATVGKFIGLDYKDMIPFSSIATGQQKIGQTPAIQLVNEATRVKDDYGQEIDAKQRIKNLGKASLAFIPGGVQARKTFEGLDAVKRGFSPTKTGNVQYPVSKDTGTKVRAALFGKNNLPAAQEYFDKERKPLSGKQSQKFINSTDSKGFYDRVMKQRDNNASNKKEKEQVKSSGLLDISSKAAEPGSLPTFFSESQIQQKFGSQSPKKMGELEKKYFKLDPEVQKDIKQSVKDGEKVPDSQLAGAFLGKSITLPSSNRYEKDIRTKSLLADISTIGKSETLSDQQKQKLISIASKKAGLSREQISYYEVAKQNTNQKTLYILDQIEKVPDKQLLTQLQDWRQMVNGKQVLSDEVINNLVSEGKITDLQGSALKKIDYNPDGSKKIPKPKKPKKISIKKTTFRPIKLKPIKPIKIKIPKKPKFKKFKSKRVSFKA